MKKTRTILALVMGIFTLMSFHSRDLKKEVKLTDSKIKWIGYKLGSNHYGTINLKSGFFNFDDNQNLEGGEFVVDMNSIVCDDLEGEYKQNIENHLKSDDFFSSDKYATSKLVIVKAVKEGEKWKVEANLTIKDKTNPVSFELMIKENKVTGKVVIDRAKFGVKYNSTSFFKNLGDKIIKDNFDLEFDFSI